MPSEQVLLFSSPAQPGETEDAPARRAALDCTESVLVQAPAGAGKTNLLTERFLALLARVEAPEQVLAITFTRAATAEMRGRILRALAAARCGEGGVEPMAGLARAALAHSDLLGWALLEQPHRLQIETIDSLCLRLAHGQPLLARLGGALAPVEDAGVLYQEAARRTLALLDGSGGPELTAALERVLLRRDNTLPEVEALLAGMLARRDAWLSTLPLDFREEVDWAAIRTVLEEPFAEENRFVSEGLEEFLHAGDELSTELLALARYAGENLEPDHALRQYDSQPREAAAWLAIADLLLTQKNEWRKSWTVREGFPGTEKGAKAEKELRQTFKQRMKDCCSSLAEQTGLLPLLCRLRALPPERYSEDQWETLTAVLRLLRRAAGELRLVFAEQNAVDFVEIARAAEEVLRDEGSLRGLLESEQKQHILVDEFQDTSRAQHRLLGLLLKEWTPGDGRTVFLVGDPLQSIYGFRQAEVALFHQTREQGLPCGENGRRLECRPLQLTHNFRSHGGLVRALNQRMEAVFAGSSADRFVAAEASGDEGPSFAVHPVLAMAGENAGALEAARVVAVLQAELPRVAEAQAAGASEYRIAVLVRSRAHLTAILPALRAARIPYRAVDLQPLGEQPEIEDAYALTRALLHPADRRAWLTVLRAPWCGLGLRDLHTLAGADDPQLLAAPLVTVIPERLSLLSPEGQARLGRTWAVLEAALRTRYTEGNGLSLAAWVERAWTALGGPATVDGPAADNMEAFWRLLDGVSASGTEVLAGEVEERLAKMVAAPDPQVSERFGVQVMTIHKSKGLGFETVLLPGLERKPRGSDRPLLAFLEREDGALLAAPIGSKEEEADRLYSWVEAQKRERDAAERKRLFYVACTRARKRLHLFGAVERSAREGLRAPSADSLLGAAWAGLQADFEGAAAFGNAAAPATLPALAAAAAPSGNVVERLPADWAPSLTASDAAPRVKSPARALFARPEGSAASRARGVAVHALMERLAAGAQADELPALARRALRDAGLPAGAAAELAGLAERAAASPAGRWIFAPHPEAHAESAFQFWDRDGRLRTVRVDRTFLAGAEPGSEGATHRWIVDYKTTPPGTERSEAWRDAQKTLYGPQLEAYGRVLGNRHPLRFALLYPELLELITWEGA